MSGGDGDFVEGTMDEDKASSYGIPLTYLGGSYGNVFVLWSGQETDARVASAREFASVNTYWDSYSNRGGSGPGAWAVCVGE